MFYKRRISLWQKIFRQDLKRQADFVELAGWVSLIIFLIFLGLLFAVKIDITVPATAAKLVKLPSGDFVVQAGVVPEYALSINEGQKVVLKFISLENNKIKCYGEITEIEQGTETASAAVKIRPDCDAQRLEAFSQQLKSMSLRIIVKQERLVTFFIEKQP